MYHDLEISVHQDEQKSNPQQKKFNRLLKKIQQQQLLLDEWRQAQQTIQQKAAVDLLPKYADLHQLVFKQIELLYHYKQQHKVPKTYLKKLDFILKQQIAALIPADTLSEQQALFLQNLYQQYWPQVANGYDEIEMDDEQLIALKKQEVKDSFLREFDIDPDELNFDFDPDDINDIQTKFEAFLQDYDRKQEKEFVRQFGEEAEAKWEKSQQQAERREQKKQEKIIAAQKLAQQSLKSIYLGLVAKIHPDRETDDEKKIEKTALMQKITTAYEQDDLLTLLQLQMQLMEDKAQQLSKLAKEQLALYIINLEQQSEKIQQQIDEIIYEFDWSEFAPYRQNINVKDLEKKFKFDVKAVEQKLIAAEQQVASYQDPEQIKLYLKNLYIPKALLQDFNI